MAQNVHFVVQCFLLGVLLMFKFLFTAVAAVALAGSASAAISIGPTIGGLATFTDSNTQRNWVQTNVFFDQSPTSMINAVTSAGFTLANRADVEALLGSLPLDAGQWSGIAAIMGNSPSRDLIWAAYGPITVNNNYGYAYAFSGDGSWSFLDDVAGAGVVQNGGSAVADMNIWAYAGGVGAVPEPASWAMLIAGFGLVGAAARRRRAVAA